MTKYYIYKSGVRYYAYWIEGRGRTALKYYNENSRTITTSIMALTDIMTLTEFFQYEYTTIKANDPKEALEIFKLLED